MKVYLLLESALLLEQLDRGIVLLAQFPVSISVIGGNG